MYTLKPSLICNSSENNQEGTSLWEGKRGEDWVHNSH